MTSSLLSWVVHKQLASRAITVNKNTTKITVENEQKWLDKQTKLHENNSEKWMKIRIIKSELMKEGLLSRSSAWRRDSSGWLQDKQKTSECRLAVEWLKTMEWMTERVVMTSR